MIARDSSLSITMIWNENCGKRKKINNYELKKRSEGSDEKVSFEYLLSKKNVFIENWIDYIVRKTTGKTVQILL